MNDVFILSSLKNLFENNDALLHGLFNYIHTKNYVVLKCWEGGMSGNERYYCVHENKIGSYRDDDDSDSDDTEWITEEKVQILQRISSIDECDDECREIILKKGIKLMGVELDNYS